LLVKPKDWTNIKFAEFSIEVPLDICIDIKAIYPFGHWIIFEFATNSMSVSIVGPFEKDYIPFSSLYETYHVIPSDLSIFNSRKQNQAVKDALLTKEVMQAISAEEPYQNKINLIFANGIKILCIKESGTNTFSAAAYVYNLNERLLVFLGLYGYKSEKARNKDLYQILGGLHIPDKEIDMAIVEKDIQRLINNFTNSSTH